MDCDVFLILINGLESGSLGSIALQGQNEKCFFFSFSEMCVYMPYYKDFPVYRSKEKSIITTLQVLAAGSCLH